MFCCCFLAACSCCWLLFPVCARQLSSLACTHRSRSSLSSHLPCSAVFINCTHLPSALVTLLLAAVLCCLLSGRLFILVVISFRMLFATEPIRLAKLVAFLRLYQRRMLCCIHKLSYHSPCITMCLSPAALLLLSVVAGWPPVVACFFFSIEHTSSMSHIVCLSFYKGAETIAEVGGRRPSTVPCILLYRVYSISQLKCIFFIV